MDSETQYKTDPWYLRVVDLKQFDYCPRVVYYQYCLPDVRPTTYKMEAGIAAQDRVESLEPRRTLKAYGLAEGERRFNVALSSDDLGCSGQADMTIETRGDDAEIIPVDFKLSRREPGRHFKLQLACYGLMLEKQFGKPARRGFIYLIPSKRTVAVELTTRLRNEAKRKLGQMRTMILNQQMPAPTRQRNKCIECEFRRFCNDVV